MKDRSLEQSERQAVFGTWLLETMLTIGADPLCLLVRAPRTSLCLRSTVDGRWVLCHGF